MTSELAGYRVDLGIARPDLVGDGRRFVRVTRQADLVGGRVGLGEIPHGIGGRLAQRGAAANRQSVSWSMRDTIRVAGQGKGLALFS